MSTAPSPVGSGDGSTPLHRRLFRAAAGTFVLNVAGNALNLGIAIVLARVLGLAEYGVVLFVMATLLILIMPSVFGLDRLLTKEVAVRDRRNELPTALPLLSGARAFALVSSCVIALVTAGVAWLLSGGRPSPLAVGLWIGMLALPFATWNRLQQGAILGLRRIVTAQVPEMLVRPLVFLALVLLCVALLGTPLAPELVVALLICSYAAAALAGGAVLWARMPRAGQRTGIALPSLRVAAPFAAIGGASVVNSQAGIVLLGLMATAEQAGIYGAAARLALLIPFPLMAVNAFLAPTAARLWDAGRLEELRRVVTLSARLTLVLSVPAAVGFMFFGGWFLGLAFPPSFAEAAPALAILSAGQLVNASMGSVSTLLLMSGQERVAAGGVIGGALILVLLCVVLIPLWGVIGAATASAVSLTAFNVWLGVATRSRLGIDSTALGMHPSSLPGRAQLGRPVAPADAEAGISHE